MAQPGHITFYEPLFEDGFTPWLRYDMPGSVAYATTIINANYADALGGSATPIIDATNASLEHLPHGESSLRQWISAAI